jgi:hypothetical protein
MTRRTIALLTLLIASIYSGACGDRAAAPEKVASTSTSTAGSASTGSASPASYAVMSETPQNGTLLASIQVPRSAREPEVKSAVESFVASRRDRYTQIAVRTFFEGSAESDSPYAISRFKGDSTRHEFFSSALEQKIPTH